MIMEYQKIIYLLDNTLYQPSQVMITYWVEINDNSHGTYSTNSEIKLKTLMLKSSLCDYSDVFISVKGTITTLNTGIAANHVWKK